MAFACAACQKSFENYGQYSAHCNTHETCAFPGCGFEGSKRVVTEHYDGTHGVYSGAGYKMIEVEGAEFRVLLGTDPQQVAEWRAERRKRWPSRANLAAREAAKRSKTAAAPEPSEPTGLLGLANYDSDSDSGAVEGAAESAESPSPAPPRTGARQPNPCLSMLHGGTCARGDSCKYAHDVSNVPRCEFFAKHGSCRRGRGCRFAHHDGAARERQVGPTAFVPPGGTMLRKLLHRDITRETSLVLQCITHLLDERVGDPLAEAGSTTHDGPAGRGSGLR